MQGVSGDIRKSMNVWRARAFVVLIGILVCGQAWALSEAQIVRATIGEAEGLSLYEQQAIAGAIINRGHLGGVFGYQRVLTGERLAKARVIGLKAVNQARLKDVSNGATHFLSNWDLKHCRPSLIAWRKKMRVTARTKNFVFYKEV